VLRLSPVRSSTAPSESTPACINGSSAPTERPSVACTACSTDDLIATAASEAPDDLGEAPRALPETARWLRPPPRFERRGSDSSMIISSSSGTAGCCDTMNCTIACVVG